jgi:hypothetical protein
VNSGTGVRLRLEKRKKGFLFHFFPKEVLCSLVKNDFPDHLGGKQATRKDAEEVHRKYFEFKVKKNPPTTNFIKFYEG